jgi:hypothetical protein
MSLARNIAISFLVVIMLPFLTMAAPEKRHYQGTHPEKKQELDSVHFMTYFHPDLPELEAFEYSSGKNLVLDSMGNTYLSVNFSIEPIGNKLEQGVAALAKFDPTGALLFTLIFGDPSYATETCGLSLDQQGNVWIAGNTNDPLFPQKNPWKKAVSPESQNIFLSQVSAEGILRFSTLLGGSGNDQITSFAMDLDHHICLVGSSTSQDFFVDDINYQTTLENADNFIALLDSQGSFRLVKSWLSSATTEIHEVVMDTERHIYIGGNTSSEELPVVNAFQPTLAAQKGRTDAFLAKISYEGEILFCTYLGGTSTRYGGVDVTGIVLGPEQQITLTGETVSIDFPVKNYQWGTPEYLDGLFLYNTFLATFSAKGQLLLSDYLGATSSNSINRDSQGNYYLTTYWSIKYRGHYPEAFYQQTILRTNVNDISKLYVFLPNLQPLYSLLLDTSSINRIAISPNNDYFCFSGVTWHDITTKNAIQDQQSLSVQAVLGKIQLPPSLAKPKKLLLQIGQEKATLMEKGKVTLLPPLEAPPMIVQGRTLIPVRVLAETMGMEVSWVSVGQYIWLDRDGVRLELQIGRNYAWKYALDNPEKREKLEMDVPPMIVNNRNLLPLRFVTENFGALVDWNGFEQKILVSCE